MTYSGWTGSGVFEMNGVRRGRATLSSRSRCGAFWTVVGSLGVCGTGSLLSGCVLFDS